MSRLSDLTEHLCGCDHCRLTRQPNAANELFEEIHAEMKERQRSAWGPYLLNAETGERTPLKAGLPTEAAARKATPIFSGVLRYFPDALADVARLSKVGNDQHNPGQPLHWAKGKSTDHADCATRHLLESGTIDTDGVRHSAKLAWRALALLQIEIEAERAGLSYAEYIAELEKAHA